jgi:hypothetical protein
MAARAHVLFTPPQRGSLAPAQANGLSITHILFSLLRRP